MVNQMLNQDCTAVRAAHMLLRRHEENDESGFGEFCGSITLYS
jgi:hypothetical protein